jgi:hypothetical protein
MPVRSVGSDNRDVRRRRRPDATCADRVDLVSNRVDVIALSAARAVCYTGGWMFDLVSSAWDVAVHIAEPGDARPLLIVGARRVDLDRSSPLHERSPAAQILAVDAQLYRSDVWARRAAREAIARLADVRLWGQEHPAALGVGAAHRLRLAARAFKAQALTAASGQDDAVDVAELFERLLGSRDPRSVSSTRRLAFHSDALRPMQVR